MLYDALYRAFLLETGNDAKWLDALLAGEGLPFPQSRNHSGGKPLGASQTFFPAPGHAPPRRPVREKAPCTADRSRTIPCPSSSR